jgi:carboxylate-amine ligase
VEEELMIIDAGSLDLAQAIEPLLAAVPAEFEGQVKPELMQSVLEVATKPCPDVSAAGAELEKLRRVVTEIAESQGLRIGAAGTHPFARYAEQKIVERPRYKELAAELSWIADQEIIFGTHIHVAIEGADRAIYVADGIRRYLPLFLALSANSPFWQGIRTGMMSSRTAIFRAFPRVGIPPHYGTWEIYSNRVELMMRAGAIEDYTYLWWDVRPHPNLGTVETRIFDQQTRLEHTVAFAALTASLAHRLCDAHDDGDPLVEYPTELVDDNKVRAALRGTEGKLVDFYRGEQVVAKEMALRLLDQLAENAEQLGCRAELEGIEDLCRTNGAQRQLAFADRGGDVTDLVTEIVEKSRV